MSSAEVSRAAIDALMPVFMTVASTVAARLAVLVERHSRYERWENAVLRLDSAVGTTVRELEQLHVEAIRRVSPHGLGIAIQKLLRGAALARVEQHLGLAGLAALEEVLSLDRSAVQRFIHTRIEASVFQLRSLQRRAQPRGRS
jgi:hypothetical protein